MRDKNTKIEILAPGGSLEGIKAAYRAGADAVYTGGTKFGAREYANNLDFEQMKEAIDYAHIHDRKLYLTVNTLLKDYEIDNHLYDYIYNIANLGIDAVIVQDFGVMKIIHEFFPQLPIHASTQMTIMGDKTVEWLKNFGVSRIVTPREMSLSEIKNIYASTNMEIESFVHGALCYCYSGQCFMSSYIGGRSGNRGRCAQPCRMEYDLFYKGQLLNKGDSKYILSPKDINTLTILPEIVEAGVYSLKIEGRMKKPEYAAGITALYRKYVDLYLEGGKKNYHVEKEDMQAAFDLFNRNGFSTSYYKQHNSKEMITIKKPAFRQENTDLISSINEKYINNEIKENINIYISILKDQPIIITTQRGDFCSVTYGNIPSKAEKLPITIDSVKKQLSKLGNTPFKVENLEDIQVQLDKDLFVSIKELNELRRKSINELITIILSDRRSHNYTKEKSMVLNQYNHYDKTDEFKNSKNISVLVSNISQLNVVLQRKDIGKIYIEADRFGNDINKLHDIIESNNSTKFYLAMPRVFRNRDTSIFFEKYNDVMNLFEGYLVRNIEEYFYLNSNSDKEIIFDYNVYTFNKYSKDILSFPEDNNKKIMFTLPVELNRKELATRGVDKNEELIAYGYMPSMTTANCVINTCDNCKHNNDVLQIKDRTNQFLNIQCICDYCYNIIYNTKPISLIKFNEDIDSLGINNIRLEFTFEKEEEVKNIIDMYHNTFVLNNVLNDNTDSTRGHFNKGVM